MDASLRRAIRRAGGISTTGYTLVRESQDRTLVFIATSDDPAYLFRVAAQDFFEYLAEGIRNDSLDPADVLEEMGLLEGIYDRFYELDENGEAEDVAEDHVEVAIREIESFYVTDYDERFGAADHDLLNELNRDGGYDHYFIESAPLVIHGA